MDPNTEATEKRIPGVVSLNEGSFATTCGKVWRNPLLIEKRRARALSASLLARKAMATADSEMKR